MAKQKLIHDGWMGIRSCNPNKKGNITMIHDRVTCKKCMQIIIDEWRRQTTFMEGQPLKNAIEGLKIAEERMKELNKITKR